MAEEEAVPNIDWGYAGDGTVATFTFSTMPNRNNVLRLKIGTTDGREIGLIISYNATVGLQKACEEARQKLGF
jgi:hypothetical protein